MNRFLNGAALAAGLAAAAWVAITHAGSHPAVLPMLGLIVAAFLAGVIELSRYRVDTRALEEALAQVQAKGAGGRESQARLSGPHEAQAWLASLPENLRCAVRQRLQGERVALPGPSLTPSLTGLLVLLGLLGTFIGMIASLGGTVAALGASADLQAVRQALAAPVQGLGLAFGTSVAGVATSACLGLMSALARHDRARASRTLDTLLATTLHPLTEDHRRERMLQALQATADQGRWLPDVAQRIESALQQVAADSRAATQALLQAQTEFQTRFQEQARSDAAQWSSQLTRQFSQTSQSMEQGLRESSLLAAQQTRDLVEPLIRTGLQQLLQTVESSQSQWVGQMTRLQTEWAASSRETQGQWLEGAQSLNARLEQSTQSVHQQLLTQAEQAQMAMGQRFVEQTGQAFGEFLARFEQHSRQWLSEAAQDQAQRQAGLTTAATEAMAALRQQTTESQAREREQLAERERLLGAVDTLMQALQHAAQEQRQALDGLLATAAEKLSFSAQRFDEQALRVETALASATEQASASLSAATGQAGASTVALTQVGEQFAQAVQGFGQVNQTLGEQLARVEAALGQHLARSDEQLAYYVAQAREVIELTLGAQAQLLDDLRRLSRSASADPAAPVPADPAASLKSAA